MKAKRALWVLGIVAMLASCSSEDVLQETNDRVNNVVTFTATLDGGMETRAVDYSDVSRAVVAVYADAEATQKVSQHMVFKGTDGKFTFSIPNLNAGQKYTFLFWADEPLESEEFDVKDLKNVQFFNTICPGDAYSLATTLTPEEISQSGVQLKHAVAKITMQTTVDLTPEIDIRLHIPVYYSSFNVLTNSAFGKSEHIFLRACSNYSAGDVMGSIYLLGAEETQPVFIEYAGRPTFKKINNVPVNPNKHIILKGDYKQVGLTDANFSVTYDNNWGSNETTNF